MATANSKKPKVKKERKQRPLDQKAFVIASLRKASYRWPPRREALLRARAEQRLKRGRMVWHYYCATCPKDRLYTEKETKKDHIYPVVDPTKGFTGWDDYVKRMFCPTEHFQILCQKCHDEKTSNERIQRQLSKLTPEQAVMYLAKIQKKLNKANKKKA